MTPEFRFTITHPVYAPVGTVVDQPAGWNEATLRLERDPLYGSLVEYFEGSFIWYGSAYALLKQIRTAEGPGAIVELLTEINFDGVNWETLAESLFEMSMFQDIDHETEGPYKCTCPLIRADFWAKFINRKSTPVNIFSPVDLDGNARDVFTPVEFEMPSQTVRQVWSGESEGQTRYDIPIGKLAPVDVFDNTILDELEEKQSAGSYDTYVGILDASFLFKLKYKIPVNGLNVTARIFVWGNTPYSYAPAYPALDVYFATKSGILQNFTRTDYGTDGVDGVTVYEINFDCPPILPLNPGDLLTVFIANSSGALLNVFIPPKSASNGSFAEFKSTLVLTGNTLYQDTTCESLLLHDVFSAVVNRIVGADEAFYSEYLGNPSVQGETYASQGCASAYALLQGLQIRGYSLTEKPLSVSFQSLWAGAMPALCLGLGYDKRAGLDVIVVAPRREFFDPTHSIDIDNAVLVGTYSQDELIKSIECGFSGGLVGSQSGLDDPQLSHIYATRFKTIGKEIKNLSTFIAASLSIEETRRQSSLEKGADYQLDNNLFLLALNKTTLDTPELDENFNSITNLLNSSTRYNVRLSASRVFYRWREFWSGCLQWFSGGDFNFFFQSGKGNFAMTSELDNTDCEYDASAVTIDEAANVAAVTDFVKKPDAYEYAECPLTWSQYKTIRDNRSQAIGISRTDVNHKTNFIQTLSWKIVASVAKINVLLGEEDPIE